MEQDCKSCSTLLYQSTHNNPAQPYLRNTHTTNPAQPYLRKTHTTNPAQPYLRKTHTQQILLNPTCAKRTHNKSCSTLLDQSTHTTNPAQPYLRKAHTTNPAQPYLRKAHSMLLHSLKNDSDNTNVCITESAFSGVSLLPHGIIVSTFAAQTRNSKLKLLSR